MEKVELDKLTKLVDDFVVQLKKDLLVVQYKPTTTGVLPGVWNRMKNWWHNTVMGGNNPDNPYVYKNKFGALGREDDTKKESTRLSLSQYNFIKEQYNKLELDLSVLNEDIETESENLKKLKLWRIIDSWASKFKQAIIKQFSSSGSSVDAGNEEEADSDEENVSRNMETIPTGSPTSVDNRSTSQGNSSNPVPRTRGAPKKPRIYWNKDEGWNWGPKPKPGVEPSESLAKNLALGDYPTRAGDFPIYLINEIKKEVHEELKKTYSDLLDNFESDFKRALNYVLRKEGNNFKNSPEEALKIENKSDPFPWRTFLITEVRDALEAHLPISISGFKTHLDEDDEDDK
jgi:hypothetical protein